LAFRMESFQRTPSHKLRIIIHGPYLLIRPPHNLSIGQKVILILLKEGTQMRSLVQCKKCKNCMTENEVIESYPKGLCKVCFEEQKKIDKEARDAKRQV